MGLIVGVSIGSLVLVVAIILIIYQVWKRHRRDYVDRRLDVGQDASDMDIRHDAAVGPAVPAVPAIPAIPVAPVVHIDPHVPILPPLPLPPLLPLDLHRIEVLRVPFDDGTWRDS